MAVELRTEFADNPEMQASHETIYQSIYVQGRGALHRELAVHLRTGRALRRPRRNVQGRESRIPDMVNISARPAEIEDRAVRGHWEGDLILGKNGRSAIGTLVERSTRFVMLLHLPDRHGPEEVQAAMIAATKRLPKFIWKSLTWDQGIEMRNPAEIPIAIGLEIYLSTRPSCGSAARTKTPTACCGSISPRAPTSASMDPSTWTSWPPK